MKTVLIFVVVCVVYVNAQVPQKCIAPPTLQGVLHESDTRRTFNVHANWTYDTINQRIRIDEGIQTNKSEYRQYYDTIILFRERVQYKYNLQTNVCNKSELTPEEKFYPIEVPPDAQSFGEAVIGSNVDQNLGLNVNLWGGPSPRDPEGRYFGSWTSNKCIPVLEIHSLPKGVVFRQSFFDISTRIDYSRFDPFWLSSCK